jgi:hypothetical protein
VEEIAMNTMLTSGFVMIIILLVADHVEHCESGWFENHPKVSKGTGLLFWSLSVVVCVCVIILIWI